MLIEYAYSREWQSVVDYSLIPRPSVRPPVCGCVSCTDSLGMRLGRLMQEYVRAIVECLALISGSSLVCTKILRMWHTGHCGTLNNNKPASKGSLH